MTALTATQQASADLSRRVGLDFSQLPSDGTRRQLPALRWYRVAVAARDAFVAANTPAEQPIDPVAAAKLRGLVDALVAQAQEERAKSVASRTPPSGGVPFYLSGSGWWTIVEATSTGIDNFLDVLCVGFT